MTPALVAAAAATVFRAVPLACRDGRLAISGGGVLQLADPTMCERVHAGKTLGITLDEAGRASVVAIPADARPASEIPRGAYALAPAGPEEGDPSTMVTVTIDVTVPPRTPQGDDLYLSTERSGWSPSEVRMDRVDARHFRLALKLRSGARLAFRITRGSFGTMERDAARALPPAHVLEAKPNLVFNVDVPAWADID